MELIRHPEITPLEISDVRVDGATLWEWSQNRGFASALRRALNAWHAGAGATEVDESTASVLFGIDAVFLTGGRVEDEALRGELRGVSASVAFGEEPLFSGARGGFDLLQTHGLSGWVADLGKSQLKLAAPGRRWTFQRDWTRLRMSGEVSLAEVPAQRRRLREFIALRLQMAMAESGERPRALVAALPVKMDDDGSPHRSNYAGMKADRRLLPDAMEQAGLAGLPLFVLNDAALAALSALSDPRLAGFRKVLVLTLGFGIGAALIHRDNGTMCLQPSKIPKIKIAPQAGFASLPVPLAGSRCSGSPSQGKRPQVAAFV